MSSSTSQNTTPASSSKQVLSGPLSSHPVTPSRLNREDAVVGMLGTVSLDPSESVPPPGPQRLRPAVAAAKVEQGGLPSPSIVVESDLEKTDGDDELLFGSSYDADARPVDLGLLRSGSWTHEEFERASGDIVGSQI